MDSLAGGTVDDNAGGPEPVAEAHVAAGSELEEVEAVDTA